MSYKIRIADDALKNVTTPIPQPVLADLHQQLKRFAESPMRYSRPSRLPFVLGEQCFEFFLRHEMYQYFFHVPFKYSQDETTILISRIGMIRYGLPDT